MKLYHTTTAENVQSILNSGLKFSPFIGLNGEKNPGQWLYLSPKPFQWPNLGDIVFEVETGSARLTCFEDCEEWEVLCWEEIPPEQIRLLKEKEDYFPPESDH